MARIRNIKPDFWTDEKLVELEPWERLLFIGVWSFVDDEGYMPYSPKRIKMQVFPGDSLEVSRGLQNLISMGALTLYDSDSGQILKVTNWEKHQKVSNPTKSKYPPLGLRPIGQEPRKQAEVVPQITESSVSATEFSRELHKEREGEREGVKKNSSSSPAAPSKEFDQFWAIYPKKVSKQAALKAWNRVTKKTPAAEIIEGAKTYAAETRDQEARFIKGPDGWLNAGRWEDDPLPARGISDAHLTTSEKRIATNIRALQSYEPTIHEDPFAQKAIRA